eukprot:TRINITY_DN3599_c0_g2_i2.p1 TRINITY_DN3599_c0_g2~~TRINITY_DN3599_c0_g2_i2.p1  ORF type:complete len:141 (+),score=21.79 TRINITY_DN3599_c0_g2_i2:67-489(+)
MNVEELDDPYDGGDDPVVKDILKKRTNKGVVEYYVEWSDGVRTWSSLTELEDFVQEVRQYEKSIKEKRNEKFQNDASNHLTKINSSVINGPRFSQVKPSFERRMNRKAQNRAKRSQQGVSNYPPMLRNWTILMMEETIPW